MDNDSIVDTGTNPLGGAGLGQRQLQRPELHDRQDSAECDDRSGGRSGGSDECESVSFTVVFSEAVPGFAGADVSFVSSTIGGTLVAAVSGTGPSYSVAVTGMTGTGTVVASVPAGAASDAAGNASSGSTSTDNTVTVRTRLPMRHLRRCRHRTGRRVDRHGHGHGDGGCHRQCRRDRRPVPAGWREPGCGRRHAPYSVSWNSTAAADGSHTLLARARDAAGNVTTSSPVTVTVSNGQSAGLVAAWNFDETSGSLANDSSGNGNTATLVNGVARTPGTSGGGLTFDGVDDYLNVPELALARHLRHRPDAADVDQAAGRSRGTRSS